MISDVFSEGARLESPEVETLPHGDGTSLEAWACSHRHFNELYALLRLRSNFFLPSMKILEKRREGSRVIRHHEKAKTPYQRILESPHVSASIKRRLKKQFKSINPAAIERRIQGLDRRLTNLVQHSPGGEQPACRDTPKPESPSSSAPRHRSNVPSPCDQETRHLPSSERRYFSERFYVRQRIPLRKDFHVRQEGPIVELF